MPASITVEDFSVERLTDLPLVCAITHTIPFTPSFPGRRFSCHIKIPGACQSTRRGGSCFRLRGVENENTRLRGLDRNTGSEPGKRVFFVVLRKRKKTDKGRKALKTQHFSARCASKKERLLFIKTVVLGKQTTRVEYNLTPVLFCRLRGAKLSILPFEGCQKAYYAV